MQLSGEEFRRVSQVTSEGGEPRGSAVSGSAGSRHSLATSTGRGGGQTATLWVSGLESAADREMAHRIADAAVQEPDVREQIVASLRERVESGDYQVSGEQVAEMMLRRILTDRVR